MSVLAPSHVTDRVVRQVAALPEDHGTLALLVEVGSTLHGTGIPGSEDLDLLGVAVPTADRLLGLQGDWETWTWRTQPQGAPSGPGDVDLTVHSLRKYLGLVLAGNPSILLTLFAPDAYVHYQTDLGDELRREARRWCRSREAGARFRGYLRQQRARFDGERARHGRIRVDGAYTQTDADGTVWDRKYAMHMIRLAYQGIEFLQTGEITLPMSGAEAETCRSVRRGDAMWTRGVVAALVDRLDEALLAAWDASPLPEHADRAAAGRWLTDAHLHAWAADRETP